jgi:hypothetical protein
VGSAFQAATPEQRKDLELEEAGDEEEIDGEFGVCVSDRDCNDRDSRNMAKTIDDNL